jgi:hypothetical protein
LEQGKGEIAVTAVAIVLDGIKALVGSLRADIQFALQSPLKLEMHDAIKVYVRRILIVLIVGSLLLMPIALVLIWPYVIHGPGQQEVAALAIVLSLVLAVLLVIELLRGFWNDHPR